MLSLAQKKKHAKVLINQVNAKVMKALESAPADWDAEEIQAYISKQFVDSNVEFALRGNTTRGRAFNTELANNRAL
jgi:hypothetical protein